MASDKKSGMSSTFGSGGHSEPNKAPSLKKGTFQQVGTFIDEGEMTTVSPTGTSVNKKTGNLQVGSAEF